MKTHESRAARNGSKGQQRPGSELIMQVHENDCIKRAGVAGGRARAKGLQGQVKEFIMESFNVGIETIKLGVSGTA